VDELVVVVGAGPTGLAAAGGDPPGGCWSAGGGGGRCGGRGLPARAWTSPRCAWPASRCTRSAWPPGTCGSAGRTPPPGPQHLRQHAHPPPSGPPAGAGHHQATRTKASMISPGRW